MKQRINDERLIWICGDLEAQEKYGIKSDEKLSLALDLKDARSEIARLKALSASQSEALDLADRGKL